MQFRNKAYLLTGSNVGNRMDYLQQSAGQLNDAFGTVVHRSAVYETAAWGLTAQPAFLNQALEFHTRFTAEELMNHLLQTEEKMGRKRKEKYGPRIIDIDILLFNEEVHDTPHCTIPHPELPNRMFALKPLADIAAGMVHPVLHKTVQQLLAECRDDLPVVAFAPA